MTTVNLIRYTADGKVRNLSGKDRGLAAREDFDLDRLDQGNEPIVVIVPDYVYSISTSFFCGLFADSYGHLGEDGFREHYVFRVPAVLLPQIEQGIDRCAYEFQPLMAVG